MDLNQDWMDWSIKIPCPSVKNPIPIDPEEAGVGCDAHSKLFINTNLTVTNKKYMAQQIIGIRWTAKNWTNQKFKSRTLKVLNTLINSGQIIPSGKVNALLKPLLISFPGEQIAMSVFRFINESYLRMTSGPSIWPLVLWETKLR